MAAFRDQLDAHLRTFRSAPFLFVGAGMPRRYLGVDDWMSLLRRLADFTDRPFDYFVASGDDDLAKIAAEVARVLHEPFWHEARFEDIRARYHGKLRRKDSALKALASDYFSHSLEALPTDGELAHELDLLRNVVIDGVITTNFDPLLEVLFPQFRVFVGQEELLFEDVMSVGEIYKIHGSHEEPDSLVLTKEDYDKFGRENPVLAAKLMTVFVEHPVLFLGYSLSDPNVAAILQAIVGCLKTPERIARLRDRLIFVIWDPAAAEATIAHISMPVAGSQIPVLSVTVADFVDVFASLGAVERKFPAKLLRALKEQVYELVLVKDPKGKLYVHEIDDDQDPREVDVVFGVGAIGRLTAYAGLTRDDLITDTLEGGRTYDPLRVVQEALPAILVSAGNVPVFKSLREAKLLDDQGSLVNPQSVHAKVRRRVEQRETLLGVMPSQRERVERRIAEKKTLEGLIEADPTDTLYCIPGLPPTEIPLPRLKAFLDTHSARTSTVSHHSQWVKVVCLYDWLTYGAMTSTGVAARSSTRSRRVAPTTAEPDES